MIPIIEFVLGIAVLVYSAEKLIGYLVGIASRWAVSLFLIAVIFTGIEFDDLTYGLVANLEDLEQVALGSVIGTTIALMGIVLALAALIVPCRVDVPKHYLALFLGAPVVMSGLALTGALTLVTGLVLVALFVAFVVWIGIHEYASRRPVFRNAEFYEQLEKVGGNAGGVSMLPYRDVSGGRASAGSLDAPGGSTGFRGLELPNDLRIDQGFLNARQHSLWRSFALTVLALVGLVVGAIVAGQGTAGILDTFDIDGTILGVTIVALALSLEDIFLTVEPARRGAPEIGIANIIGSVVFSMTGKLGIILLVGGTITVNNTVMSWHLPALLAMTTFTAIFLATGMLRRWHGAVLLTLYSAYFVISLMAFGGVPLDSD